MKSGERIKLKEVKITGLEMRGVDLSGFSWELLADCCKNGVDVGNIKFLRQMLQELWRTGT